MMCDQTDAVADTTCGYKRTVGTKFSEEFTNGMHIDTSVAAEMQLQFWLLFEDKLGVSVNTGYDWKHTSSEVKGDQITREVVAPAPAGMVLVIEQINGHCGQSGVKTECFKISHLNSTGQVVLEKSGRFLENQEFVETACFKP